MSLYVSKMRASKLLIPLVTVALLSACAGGAAPAATPTPTKTPESPLLKAVDICGLPGSALSDKDATLFIDTAGKDIGSGTLDYDDLDCVLKMLDTPQSVRLKMDGTRALDGRQTDSWDDIEATWSYHPDNGLDVILELAD
jgi:hypothetical protein